MKLRWLGVALLLAGVAALAQQNPQPPAGAPAVAQPQMDQQMQRMQQDRQAMQQRMDQLQQQRQQMQQQMDQQMQRVQQDREALQQRMDQMSLQRQQMPPQGRPPLERALGGPAGKWWDRPDLAQRLLLTSDQQKKMDDVFQQARLKLIDLNASVEKEELTMEPLVSAEQPDEVKIVAQIDKAAQARAELEKANARMLLGIRRVLTQDQWNKLKAETGNNPPPPLTTSPRQNPPPVPAGAPRKKAPQD